jgi:hypothetical protein
MGHFKEGALTPMSELYGVMDSFAEVVPRLQLTEFDVDAGDEQLQADYLRDVMTIAFSHPAVEGIVMWGFWEGRHVRPQCALWRRDWSLKPSGEAWRKLVFEDWWTDETVRTDAAGQCTLRAFLGVHDVTATARDARAEQTVELGPEGASVELRLAP